MHPTIQVIVVKNLLVGGAIYYWVGQQALLWWTAASALLHGLVALNAVPKAVIVNWFIVATRR